MKIVSMEVRFERSVKRAEFENEKAGVTLGISPDDPDSSLTSDDLAAASALAKMQVYTTLGLPVAVGNGGKVTTKASVVPASKTYASVEGLASTAAREIIVPAWKPGTEIGDEIEVVIKTGPTNTAKPVGRPKGSTNKPKEGIPPPPKAPNTEIGEDDGDEAGQETPGTAADVAEAAEPVQGITNGDLAKAIGKKVQAMVSAGNPAGSVAVTKLIKDFVPAGKQGTHPNIPDDMRAGFIMALEAIE